MSVEELFEKYNKDIIDESNPTAQEKALSEVIIILLNELKEIVDKNKYHKKKDIKKVIEESNEKYVKFVEKINEKANKDLLKDNGFKMVTDKQFRFFF